jgi:hypothetical protein
VERAGRCVVRELNNCSGDPAPGRGAVMVASDLGLAGVGALSRLLHLVSARPEPALANLHGSFT